MEFDFDINNLFGNEITVLNKQLNPYRATPACFREYKSQLCTVIDQMGVASAKAQGLHGPITSVSRMSSSEHILYVMKDPCAHKGKGAVVGFLKVGVKKLFVYDGEGTQHEIEPLCALDFYVHESRQRNGCGRRIFDHMLRTENVKPQHIAIDRPSHKFLSFLMKHYHLRNSLPQRNNFVIFDGFLKSSKGRKCNADHNKPPAHPYQRQGLLFHSIQHIIIILFLQKQDLFKELSACPTLVQPSKRTFLSSTPS
ncbi:hypothetical protein CAPTEDRAFT_195309 [Capitella teleta]|uniref:Alpha-tubulin N-acetyltransferase n=1 Tax=Capitella teleta TaxID=283909 RepID=R7TCL8_CAPTE|nr:hypothetical protein CAPTEDRAFT_195309 [Capitella teleta]|eukprot:ELT91483.1 hypothetical protein CAPTEDRAFT_195309 [Capitella teleta]